VGADVNKSSVLDLYHIYFILLLLFAYWCF